MRKPYRLLYPMGVVLISSSLRGKDNVMTACWAFPLSFEPSLFGISIGKKRFSHGLIEKSKEFVINIPGEDLIDAVLTCGENSGREVEDKFALAKITKEKSEKVAAPSINECLASIECKVIYSTKAGDHTLFIGEAINIKQRKKGKRIIQTEKGILTTF